MKQSIPDQSEAQTTNGAIDGQIDGSLSYEVAFEQLQQVLSALEAGDLPLNEALDQYERGAALSTYCLEQLDGAELRVRRWLPTDEAPNGAVDELGTVDVDDWS